MLTWQRLTEAASVGSFVVVVVATLGWSGICTFGVIRSLVKRKSIKPVDLLGTFIGLLGIACIAYAIHVEPYQLDVTRWTLESSKLPVGAHLRIVHISDTHCEPEPRLEPALPALVAKYKPDLIVFSGDSINSRKALPVFRKCMSQLSKIAPTYIAYGNHDSRNWCDLNLVGGTGCKILNGQLEKLSIRDIHLCLTGVAVDDEARMGNNLEKIPPETFNVFVYHYPWVVLTLGPYHVDMVCAGHTHGGQVRLPFYGAITTGSKTGKRFEAGLYQVNNTWLSVNRGLGTEGGLAPKVRFMCRPEVTVLDVKSASAQTLLKRNNTERELQPTAVDRAI